MPNQTPFVFRRGLLLGGGLILLIGLGHVLMPTHGYDPAVTAGWSEAAREHFYYLATYIICGFLLTLGGLSILFAGTPPSPATAMFATVMAALWSLRLVLEFLYPVRVGIYGIEKPHVLLAATLVVVVASYLAAAFSAWRRLTG